MLNQQPVATNKKAVLRSTFGLLLLSISTLIVLVIGNFTYFFFIKPAVLTARLNSQIAQIPRYPNIVPNSTMPMWNPEIMNVAPLGGHNEFYGTSQPAARIDFLSPDNQTLVEQFYQTQLTQRGWTVFKTETQHLLNHTGMGYIEFQKDHRFIVLALPTNFTNSSVLNYSLFCFSQQPLNAPFS